MWGNQQPCIRRNLKPRRLQEVDTKRNLIVRAAMMIHWQFVKPRKAIETKGSLELKRDTEKTTNSIRKKTTTNTIRTNWFLSSTILKNIYPKPIVFFCAPCLFFNCFYQIIFRTTWGWGTCFFFFFFSERSWKMLTTSWGMQKALCLVIYLYLHKKYGLENVPPQISGGDQKRSS